MDDACVLTRSDGTRARSTDDLFRTHNRLVGGSIRPGPTSGNGRRAIEHKNSYSTDKSLLTTQRVYVDSHRGTFTERRWSRPRCRRALWPRLLRAGSRRQGLRRATRLGLRPQYPRRGQRTRTARRSSLSAARRPRQARSRGSAFRTFRPDPTSAREARRFVAETLSGLAFDIDCAQLLANELVINAVRHAGTDIQVAVSIDGQRPPRQRGRR